MGTLFDISELKCNRIFVVGALNGDYDALIRLLYQQRFTYADVLVSIGNFINLDELPEKSMELAVFLRNSVNCFSVRGYLENKFLKDVQNPEKVLEINKKLGSKINDKIVTYIQELPLVIKYRDYLIMNAGVVPSKSFDDQDPEVFYSIGEYDKDSRFYKDSKDESSWYNTEYVMKGKHTKICFGNICLSNIEVPVGYNLGRIQNPPSELRSLIIEKTLPNPIIVTTQ